MKLSLNMKKAKWLTAGFVVLTVGAHAETGTQIREALNDPLVWAFLVAVTMMLVTLVALNRALNTVRSLTIKKLAPEKAAEMKEAEEGKSLMAVLTDAKPIEREAEIMLDHDYDGIHELDNNLPPWWVWGFYISIAYAVVYLVLFHVTGTAPHSGEEYAQEMAAAEEQVQTYLATSANAVDENSVTMLVDASALAAGKKIWDANCVACHAADGGGTVGPNLTDEYWIHGGGIQNIFKTIKYGVTAKGMIAWQDQLGPLKMQQVASYVLSLQGTTPAAPKDPEGEIWVEEAEAATTDESAEETSTAEEAEGEEEA